MPKGGKREGAGRKPGVQNQITAEVKEAVYNTFTKLGKEKYLMTVAKEKPDIFFRLLGKLVPNAVDADISLDIQKVSLIDLSGDDEENPD